MPDHPRNYFSDHLCNDSRAELKVMDPNLQFPVVFCENLWFPAPSKLGAKKSAQTFSVQSFSRTLRVMDVRAENHGRPHPKVSFSAAPVMGRNFLTQGHPGVRVRNVRRKSGPKSLCSCAIWGEGRTTIPAEMITK